MNNTSVNVEANAGTNVRANAKVDMRVNIGNEIEGSLNSYKILILKRP